jgi:hypothetical protein
MLNYQGSCSMTQLPATAPEQSRVSYVADVSHRSCRNVHVAGVLAFLAMLWLTRHAVLVPPAPKDDDEDRRSRPSFLPPRSLVPEERHKLFNDSVDGNWRKLEGAGFVDGRCMFWSRYRFAQRPAHITRAVCRHFRFNRTCDDVRHPTDVRRPKAQSLRVLFLGDSNTRQLLFAAIAQLRGSLLPDPIRFLGQGYDMKQRGGILEYIVGAQGDRIQLTNWSQWRGSLEDHATHISKSDIVLAQC